MIGCATFDGNGNQLTAKDPYSKITTCTYNTHNKLLTVTLPLGRSVKNTYDASDNLTKVEEKNSSGTTVATTYYYPGAFGLLSTTTDGSGRGITYTYTVRNQMASAADNTGTTTYSYDAAGNRNYIGIPNGMHVSEYYDNAGRISSYYNYVNGSSAPAQSYGYTYNDDGQITAASEGTSAAVPPVNPVQTTYGYDAQGHLNSEARTGDGASYTYSYVYDGAGNRTSQNIVGGGATTLTYDADDELKSTSGEYNFTYGYNANGAQTSSVMGGVTTAYSYDFEDNLTLISSSAGATGYAYDGLNRQAGRAAAGSYHDYALDGDTVLSESIDGVDGPNTLWGAGYLTRWGGEYPLTDGLGNQHLVVDSSHNLITACTFSAFGMGSTYTGTSANPHVYRSMPTYRADRDGPSGGGYQYYKVGCRYYDAQFGRFITRDSVLTEKPYVYCDSDPVNDTDPTGHFSMLTRSMLYYGGGLQFTGWTGDDWNDIGDAWDTIGNYEIGAALGASVGNAKAVPAENWRPGSSPIGPRVRGIGILTWVVAAGGGITKFLGFLAHHHGKSLGSGK